MAHSFLKQDVTQPFSNRTMRQILYVRSLHACVCTHRKKKLGPGFGSGEVWRGDGGVG